MKLPSLQTIVTFGTTASFIASLICNILPKPEKVFEDFPRVQKVYRAGITFLAATAANWTTNVHSVGNMTPVSNQMQLPLDQPTEKAKAANV